MSLTISRTRAVQMHNEGHQFAIDYMADEEKVQNYGPDTFLQLAPEMEPAEFRAFYSGVLCQIGNTNPIAGVILEMVGAEQTEFLRRYPSLTLEDSGVEIEDDDPYGDFSEWESEL